MKIIKLLKHAKKLFIFLRLNKPRVVFFSVKEVNNVWVYSTIEELKKGGVSASLIVYDKPSKDNDYSNTPVFHGSGQLIKLLKLISFRVLFKTDIVVTASSGITRKMLPVKCKYLIHMPHSLVSLHMVYPQNAFDGYDEIFASGLHHVNEIKAYNETRKNFDVISSNIGYGKMDFLNDNLKKYNEKLNVISISNERKNTHVVIAASWGDGNILEVMGNELIKKLINNNIKVTLRPHPGYWGSDISKNIESDFLSSRLFNIEQGDDENSAMYSADIMISDYSGAALEFAFLHLRPVLFINVKKKVFNKYWGKINIPPIELYIRNKIGVIAEPNVIDVMNKIKYLRDNQKEFNVGILNERSKYLFNYRNCSGNSSARIIDILKSI